jgi:hypothetical protein
MNPYQSLPKITVKLGAIWLAHSLRIQLGIPSGPDAFDGFMSWSSFSTPFSLMVSFGMDSSMCLVVCGMAVDLSMVKMDLNCWINISAFLLLTAPRHKYVKSIWTRWNT